MQAKITGTLHGIWFNNPQQPFHPQILLNLSKLVPNAKQQNFDIVLWTNKKTANASEIAAFKQAGIIVKDFSACSSSQLYPYICYLLEAALAGDDKAAFALCSDVLRMAILELTPMDEYFIYADPNDIVFNDFKQSLAELDFRMSLNPFGFSFYVAPLIGATFQIRNDVLIAKKSINPSFFADYLNAYTKQVHENHISYTKPLTDHDAQHAANTITNPTSNNFFRVFPPSLGVFEPKATILALFGEGYFCGDYIEVHCQMVLPHERLADCCNTWLPLGTLEQEKETLSKIQNRHFEQKLVYMQLKRPFNPSNNSLQVDLTRATDICNYAVPPKEEKTIENILSSIDISSDPRICDFPVPPKEKKFIADIFSSIASQLFFFTHKREKLSTPEVILYMDGEVSLAYQPSEVMEKDGYELHTKQHGIVQRELCLFVSSKTMHELTTAASLGKDSLINYLIQTGKTGCNIADLLISCSLTNQPNAL